MFRRFNSESDQQLLNENKILNKALLKNKKRIFDTVQVIKFFDNIEKYLKKYIKNNNVDDIKSLRRQTLAWICGNTTNQEWIKSLKYKNEYLSVLTTLNGKYELNVPVLELYAGEGRYQLEPENNNNNINPVSLKTKSYFNLVLFNPSIKDNDDSDEDEQFNQLTK